MRARLSAAFFTISLLVSASLADAEPFGLNMGDSKDSARAGQPTQSKGSFIIRPPKPHSDFKIYMGRFADGQGLCDVLAYSDAFEAKPTDPLAGQAPQIIFKRVASQLSERYGEGEMIDTAPETPEREFASTILDGSRKYWKRWRQFETNKLPDTVGDIHLSITPVPAPGGGGYGLAVSVFYRYANSVVCKKIWEAGDKSSL